MKDSKTYQIYLTIPVYPKGIFLGSHKSGQLSISAPLCENCKGIISFISQEAKDEFIKNFK